MANNLASNVSTIVLKSVLKGWDSDVVTLESVDKSIVDDGAINPETGDTIYVKRPLRVTTRRTADGDISSGTNNTIISGRAPAVVQDYITARIDYGQVEEALEMNQIDEMVGKAIREQLITDLETDFNAFILKNQSHQLGTAGTAISKWSDVAQVSAYCAEMGWPMGDVVAQINPFGVMNLADAQKGLLDTGRAGTAWERAQITSDFGGVKAFRSNALAQFTSGTYTGTIQLASAPTQTYVSAKDTFTTTLALKGLTDTNTLTAGTVLRITGKYWLNQKTRQTARDDAGPIEWTCVVKDTPSAAAGGGLMSVVVTGPAIFEASGAYNNLDAALDTDDVVTVISGASGAVNKPNLFYHRQAYGFVTVKLPKLHSIDSTVASYKGITIRAHKYANGDGNRQYMRFDILPAYAAYNAMLSGRFWGRS